MWKKKNSNLEVHVGIPDGFKVKGGDGRAISSWNEVKNADGYILSYYRASEPELCIKTRYSQKPEKTILGFRNGWNILRMCVHINFVTVWKSGGTNRIKFHLYLFQ